MLETIISHLITGYITRCIVVILVLYSEYSKHIGFRDRQIIKLLVRNSNKR